MDAKEEHIEDLAKYIHGAMAALHGLGLVHNLKRRNWRDAAFHAGFFVYDALATYKHRQYIKSQKRDP